MRIQKVILAQIVLFTVMMAQAGPIGNKMIIPNFISVDGYSLGGFIHDTNWGVLSSGGHLLPHNLSGSYVNPIQLVNGNKTIVIDKITGFNRSDSPLRWQIGNSIHTGLFITYMDGSNSTLRSEIEYVGVQYINPTLVALTIHYFDSGEGAGSFTLTGPVANPGPSIQG